MNIVELETKVKEGMSISMLAKHFNLCSSTINYWLRKYNLKTCNSFLEEGSINDGLKCVCSTCAKDYVYKRAGGMTREKCSSCLVNDRRLKIKIDCLNYKGGKCEICGYNKCSRALSFHHLDSSKKVFSISGAHSRKWEDIVKELDKCRLICENCHMELHHKEEQEKREERKILANEKRKNLPELIKRKSYRLNSLTREASVKGKYPTNEEMVNLVWEFTSKELGEKIGVHESSVRMWCKFRNIPLPNAHYWQLLKKDKIEEASKIKQKAFENWLGFRTSENQMQLLQSNISTPRNFGIYPTREELLNLIWKTPISTLCKNFGVSGNGLKKHCKKNNIPVPPRGYWAKFEAGKFEECESMKLSLMNS